MNALQRIKELLREYALSGGEDSANKCNERGMYLTLPVPIAANGGIGPNSGDPLMFGTGTCPGFGLAGVAESSYTEPTRVATGNIAVSFEGVYYLTVFGSSTGCPETGKAINPGDKVYADPWSGGFDATTGCRYGFALNADAVNGVYFGNALDAVGSGAVATIRVRLKVTG